MEKEKALQPNNGEERQEFERVLTEYLKIVGQKVSQENVIQFLNIAKAYQLNPFKREIYLIPYGNQANIIVGYEVYLKRADRSGKLAGWRVWTEGSIEKGDLKAIIEIKRKDWEEPFRHEVFFKEYYRKTPIWEEKPITMIKKVAIAQGFRLAFPEELAGMPYTAEEIEVEYYEVPKEQKQSHEKPQALPEAPKWDIERIKQVATEELKEAIRQYGATSKILVELFNEFDGDQVAVINKLKEMAEERKKAKEGANA
jgi:phage recombination protein Bet